MMVILLVTSFISIIISSLPPSPFNLLLSFQIGNLATVGPSTLTLTPIYPPPYRSMASKSRIPSSSKASSLFSSTDSLTSDTASSVDVKHSQIGSSIPKAPLSLKLSTDSVDDFALNEKVWVNGSRPGVIRFIGETKFALGKWIGVQLTSPNGKNDGSVSGVRYFTCPDSCGVFVKPQRLTKAPMPDSVFQK